MNSKSKPTPPKLTPRGIAAGLLTLLCTSLLACLLWQLGIVAVSGTSPKWAETVYRSLSLETICKLPPLLPALPTARWFIAYFPACLVAGFIIARVVLLAYDLLLVPPKGSLIEDRVQKVRESGQDSPPLEYLPSVALVCPSLQKASLAYDLLLGGQTVRAPASKGLPDLDTPENLFK